MDGSGKDRLCFSLEYLLALPCKTRSRFKEKTALLFVPKQSKLKMKGGYFPAFEKNDHLIFFSFFVGRKSC